MVTVQSESKYAKKLAARRRDLGGNFPSLCVKAQSDGVILPYPRPTDADYHAKHSPAPDIVVDEKGRVFWSFNTYIPAAKIYKHSDGGMRYSLP